MQNSLVSNDLIAFPKRSGKAPMVFMLQPKGFKPVTTPEELALWEQWMIERVGFNEDSPILAAIRSANLPPGEKAVRWPYGGISGSNGGWDD